MLRSIDGKFHLYPTIPPITPGAPARVQVFFAWVPCGTRCTRLWMPFGSVALFLEVPTMSQKLKRANNKNEKKNS